MVLLALVLGELLAIAGSPGPEPPPRVDIYYIWRDGVRLAHGENPYEPAADEPLTKHPSYLPLFYLFVAATQWAGLHDYAAWMTVWQPLLRAVHLAIGLLLAGALWRAGYPVLGVFAALFWGANRWSLYAMRAGQIDEVALLLLLASLWAFPGRRRTSLVLLGASLAVKHVAALAAPLYLVWTWRATPARRARARLLAVAVAIGWIALLPAAASLPFVAWDAGAFARSVLFSVVRDADSHVRAPAVATVAGLGGVAARLPMLGLAALVLAAAARGEIGRYPSVLLVLAVFTDFSPVLFLQYLAWLVPLLVLAACDAAGPRAWGPAREA